MEVRFLFFEPAFPRGVAESICFSVSCPCWALERVARAMKVILE